jgi:23S rRNA (pseudouridine1915-N3)-methyltransferase
MAIKLIVFGKTKESFFIQSENEYLKRINRFVNLDYITLDSSKNETQAQKVLQAEEKILLSQLKSTAYLILLDENGKTFKNSIQFSQHMNQTLSQHTNVTFVIGGAFGFSENIKKMAQEKWSLSNLTMPHHLVRTVFLEQLYRAFTILNGGHYHNQ